MTIVRQATPADAHALVDLAESVGREDGRWILGTGPWRSVSDERRYLRTIQRHPDAAVFVAEDGPHIVGRLSLSRDPHPASRHVADLGLMVAESHRRQGVGTMLLEQAVAWAREASVRKLELHVFPWNEPALGLFDVDLAWLANRVTDAVERDFQRIATCVVYEAPQRQPAGLDAIAEVQRDDVELGAHAREPLR